MKDRIMKQLLNNPKRNQSNYMRYSGKQMISILFILNIYLVFPCFSVKAQNSHAGTIIEKLKEKQEFIRDYQAEIKISVDVDFMNIPDKKAVVYYKAPDKFKFESKGFFILPKKGMTFSVSKILDYQYTAILTGNEKVHNKNTAVIKIVPHNSDEDIVLSTFWIDSSEFRLMKTQTMTKSAGMFESEFFYNSGELPEKMIISFDVMPFELPVDFLTDPAIEEKLTKKLEKQGKKEKTKGKVTIKFNEYKINTGIPDSFFDEE